MMTSVTMLPDQWLSQEIDRYCPHVPASAFARISSATGLNTLLICAFRSCAPGASEAIAGRCTEYTPESPSESDHGHSSA